MLFDLMVAYKLCVSRLIYLASSWCSGDWHSAQLVVGDPDAKCRVWSGRFWCELLMNETARLLVLAGGTVFVCQMSSFVGGGGVEKAREGFTNKYVNFWNVILFCIIFTMTKIYLNSINNKLCVVLAVLGSESFPSPNTNRLRFIFIASILPARQITHFRTFTVF